VGTATVSSGTWTNSGDLSVGLSGNGTLTILGGLVTVGGTLSKGSYGTINLNAGGTLQIGTGGITGVLGVSTLTNNGTLVFNRSNASTYSGIISGSGAISKQGAGTLTLAVPNTLTGPTTVQQGTVQLAHASALAASTVSVQVGGKLALTPGLVTTVGALNPNAGGLVDVGTGMVTVTKDLSATVLVTALQSGRAGGSWTGSSGVTSSAAASATASSTLRSVGWLDNGNGSMTFAFTAPGDSNLDWTVDILDAGNFLSFGKFDTGLPADWLEGDFNYDATVDILDAADFFATGLYDAGSYNAPAGTIAAVPEPSVLGLVGVGAGVVGLMAARRKRAI
jgi:autotransporter-associated beta strand protein/T5SS/PEP-CTERM-associated repeat protein